MPNRLTFFTPMFVMALIALFSYTVLSQRLSDTEKGSIASTILREYQQRSKEAFLIDDNLPSSYVPELKARSIIKISRKELAHIRKQQSEFELFEFGKFQKHQSQIHVTVKCTIYHSLGSASNTYIYKFRKVSGRWKFRSAPIGFSMSQS
jgi:hypothetical protein